MIDHDKLVEYARSATDSVFVTMLDMAVTPQPEHLDRKPPMVSDGVMALVGLAGPWIGAGVVTFSAAFAIDVCNHLLMCEETAVNEDVLDAVGEVANMIIGSFKTQLEDDLGPLCLSIPTVVYGRNFTSRSVGTDDWVVLPFQYKGEVIELRICLSPSKNSVPNHVGSMQCA